MKRDCFYMRRGYVHEGVSLTQERKNDMTEKAQRILDKMKNRRAKKLDTELQEFNSSTLDDVGPVGAPDQQMRVLDEMNSLQHFENDNWSQGSV